MENTNKIIFNEEYKSLLKELEDLEKERPFCKHNLSHFLDVARICYILVLEEKLDIKKDLIYSTALLHDIGRVFQYKDGTDHHLASAKIGERILALTSFTKKEKGMIIDCIKKHRQPQSGTSFNDLFYKADKLSRICFRCPAYDICNWTLEKKNHTITY